MGQLRAHPSRMPIFGLPGQPAGRVHRDQTPHPRSSGCPLPSVPATGSSRVAERRKRAHHSLHRPLARRPSWRLVPTCGNQEVEARRSADAQASSGSCCVKALHRSHLGAGDITGASRPRAKSIPGAPRPGIRAQVRGGKYGFRSERRLGPIWGTSPAVHRAAPQDLNLLPAPWRSHTPARNMQSTATFRGGFRGALGLFFA